ncbi:histidine kinase-like ATPase [Pavlovales sp. CCMP2436]|nr:histidine kinase-like ATPase [Pavlovales sp. CCMP2436]
MDPLAADHLRAVDLLEAGGNEAVVAKRMAVSTPLLTPLCCSHEAEVELKLRFAEAAKVARGRMIRMVMHNLRSPLLSIANAVAIVQGRDPETRVDDSDVVQCLRAMATCSQLMQHIVSDMLDFERIDSGRLVLVPAAIRVSQLLEAAAHTFGVLAMVKGVSLRVVPLPSDLERAIFIGDVRRLQQCVNNGVSNSIKFTEAGGMVTIRARRGDEDQVQNEPHAAGCDAAAAIPHASVVLEVDDSGMGLTADELQVLNQGEAFTQVGLGQLQGSGGTGLGLAIARDLLRLHGGSRMHLDSAGPGHGSTFRLELTLPEAPEGTPVPLEDSSMLEDSRTAVAGTHAEGMPGGSADRTQGAGVSKRQVRPLLHFPPGFRVLHVEDDAVLRKMFELRVLKKLGVPFDVAVNGDEAVRLILEEKREYAFVLMDNQMPILTGEKATRALRAGGFEGFILGMTGDPKGCSDRDEFEAAGLSLCVDKDTPGIHRVAQVIGSFALDEALEEEPSTGSSSSLSPLPTRKASLADHLL